MVLSQKHTQTIGLVLSRVPGYSETFFRNKIKGLQDYGFRVILFVDYFNANDSCLNCEIVSAKNFNSNVVLTLGYGILGVLKSLFLHPKRSLQLYHLNKKDGISLKSNLKNLLLNQFFLAHNIDWLHFGFGMLAVGRENVASAMQAKMAVSFRGFDLYLSPLKHPDCYDLLFQKDVKYHVLSQEMKQTLIDYSISSNNIKVITPAIDTEFFLNNESIDVNPILELITVARLHWKKGLEYTLEALAYLKQQDIPFHYTIIGDGDEHERLVFAAHQLNILDCITFAGKLSHKQVKAKLEAASIYIQYSIQEGFCNAVLEAQAMGLLCIVSNAEGLAENVLDGKTGWVVPKRQPKALAQKIKNVHQMSDATKIQIIAAAKARVKTTFNLNQQHQAFINFYENEL